MAPNTDQNPVVDDPAAPETPAGTVDTAQTGSGSTANLNFDVLNAAGADAGIWGQELARFLADLTGKAVDPGSLATLFGAFGSQVQSATYQQAALAVANAPIIPASQSKEVLIAQMDLRGDLAELLLGTVS